MENNYVFDDGSIESKVLQYELRNDRPQIITVDKFENINKWLESVDLNKGIVSKVYLHFSYDQITPGIRAEVNTALTQYPNLRIILKYENMDTRTIENLASKYGITVQTMTYNTKTFKAVKHTEIASDKITAFKEVPDPEFVDKLIETNKDKIKMIDYSKYAVGGNDSAVAAIPHDNPQPTLDKLNDKFTSKSNWFRDKQRRRKTKDVDDKTDL